VVCADCTRPTQLPPSEAGQPRNLSGLKNQLLYYECSGAYSRDISRVIDKAIAYVTKRAKKGSKVALVLDIDETSLSNWEEMKANDFGLIEKGGCKLAKPDASGWAVPDTPCGFADWVLEADAKPLDTLRLFKVAKENQVAVFFITGRVDESDHKVRDATSENLRKAGYSGWTDLMLRPDHTSSIQEFKAAKRKEITEKGYTIIANVGDQYSDLKGGYAERVYKIPNPFYFVP
jgi:acid phosphatase